MKKNSSKPSKVGTQKNFKKIKVFFENRTVRYASLVILLLVSAFLIQYFANKPDFGAFLSSDMDPVSNVYVLGVDETEDEYKVTKVSPSGSTDFQIKLEKSNNEFRYSYRNLEVDSKGNFYVVKEQRDLNGVSTDKTSYPIRTESVLMYDTHGAFLKQVASMSFSKDNHPPLIPYIQKLQIVDQSMIIIGCKENTYDIIVANPLLDISPQKIKSFEVFPPAQNNDSSLRWVNDISVLSSGRIFYSTKNGQFFATGNDGAFIDYTSVMPSTSSMITGMTVDENDDIYFTDALSGTFYKLDTKSVVVQNLYDIDGAIYGNGVLMRDVRKIKAISANDFYAPSKAFDKPFHVRFGLNSVLITDLRGNFFPWGLVIMLAVCVFAVGVFYLIRYIGAVEIKRIPLGVRIIAMFVPVFIVAMGVLVYINTSDSVKEYISILRSEQERGSKTVADGIDGSSFSKLDHVSGYMTPDYVKVNNMIKESYNEIALKIGDRSDYIVAYIERYNKLYATVNTRYSSESASYDFLRYTDPDMVSGECVLIDYIMERDEAEKLYSIWNQFSNKTNTTDSLDGYFRDVYGDVSGSFVAIQDTNGRVVGFVGNFLDEGIHKNQQFNRIFQHSLSVIIIIAILIVVYIWFVVRYCLRPLKKIEKAIDVISKGEWDSRIRLESKDELADIAQAFNLMSEKISRYTSNLILLNKEYIRYVPTELFKFMDKEKITQVNLHDSKILHMNIVYITFNISGRDSYDFKDESEIFEALNKSFEEMFKVVQKNNGVVQSFDGLDAVILFPGSAQDAFNASVQFKEVNINEVIKKHMNITLGAGDVLVGVSGNPERRGVVVVSDEIMQMFNIDTQINEIGINQVATKAVIDNLESSKHFNYRFIGKILNITREGSTDIYQLIDAGNQYKKDLYISTKEIFEKGVNLYLARDFKEARKLFTDVLKINANDKVAIHYLVKCDKHLNDTLGTAASDQDWVGYLI